MTISIDYTGILAAFDKMELLGPRHGPFDQMADDPRSEYTAGIQEAKSLRQPNLFTSLDATDVRPLLLFCEAKVLVRAGRVVQ
jgi:hypothetical protein